MTRSQLHHSRHPEARHAAMLKYNYGLDGETYQQMFEQQHGLCAICYRPERAIRNGRLARLSVDHDHSTGKLRGLLCNSCNHAIGKLLDSPALCFDAAYYLMSHSTKGDS